MQGFFAGASSTTGANATIAFGSDGKIRGTGVYTIKDGSNNVDWCIEQSRVFGDGADGSLLIKKYSGGYVMGNCEDSSPPTKLENRYGFSGGSEAAFTPNYGPGSYSYDENDILMKTDSTSSIATHCVRLQRDVYLETLRIDLSGGSVEIQTNGYRLFIRDKLEFVGSWSGTKYCYIMNRGENGSAGTGGNQGGASGAKGEAGEKGTKGIGGKAGTLLGGKDGKDGRDGGDGGQNTSSSTLPAGNGLPGLNGETASGNTLYGYSGRNGGLGAAGSSGNTAAGGAVGTTGSGGSGLSTTQTGTRIQHVDPHIVTMMRDVYGVGGDMTQICPAAGSASGGSGGGGGHGGGFSSGNQAVYLGGGGGGGSGGSGGSGGIVMVCVRTVEKNQSAGTSILKLDASGGNGGNGGDGGAGAEGEFAEQ